MRILIVEDEKQMADNLQRGFTAEGYAADVAYSGEEGERLAREIAYDLIVLDIMLPGKDGIHVCRSLRDKKITTPIVMLTCKDSVSDRVLGLDSGADDYLVKPFAFAELEARLRSVLRRSRALDTPKIEIGSLIIDTVTRRVWRDGREIELLKKEYAILEILVHHVNEAVPRMMIEQHVWNMSLDSTSNLVDVYVSRLRIKLDQDGHESIIQTIRGTGYRLKMT